MKNLKRALSLALASVMLLGMMVMTTSAANFTDTDEIVNTEAVDTMTALNIINGKSDGSFDPTGIVTRAEMAKLICVALNGGKDPQLGTTAYSFKDTVGHWAAGYIEYCYNLGIVAGRGAGIFDPNGTVTGTEAAKMLLVAIGYDAAAEGFTGATWAIAVNVRANQKDFYEDLEAINPSAGLTRDSAAQMVYNAINAVMVEYEYKLTTVGGTLTTVAVVKDVTVAADTILEKKFNMTTEYGTITLAAYDEDEGEYTYTVTPAAGSTITSFTSESDYSSLFLMKAKIMYKGTDTDNVYGVYAEDSSVLVSGVVGSLPTIAAGDTSFKYAEVSYKVDSGAINVYAFNVNTDIGDLNSYEAAATSPFGFSVIDNDGDSKGDKVIVYPFTVEKVTYLGATTFTTTAGSVTTADVNVYAGMAKNDFVKVVAAANTVDNADTYTKATVLTGEVTSTQDSGATFKLDGTWYKIATAAALVTGSATTATAGNDYEKVAVVNGYAFNIIASTSTAITDYAVVTAATAAATNGLNGDQAKMLFTDGTSKIVDTAADYTGLINKMVTYTINSDDEYVLTAANEDVAVADTGFDKIVTAPDGSDADALQTYGGTYAYASSGKSTIGGNYIASDAVVFIKGTSWKVITGADLMKTSTAAITAVNNAYADDNSATGFSTITMACVSGTTTSGNTSYGYVTATPSVVSDDGTLVYSVTFWDGSKTVTANTTVAYNDASLATLAKGTIITYTYNNADISISAITALTTASATLGAVTGIAGDEIKFAVTDTTEDIDLDTVAEAVIDDTTSTATYDITSDTVTLYIDVANTAGVLGGSIQLGTGTSAGNKVANVYYVLSGTDVTLMVVDVQNDILNVQ